MGFNSGFKGLKYYFVYTIAKVCMLQLTALEIRGRWTPT